MADKSDPDAPTPSETGDSSNTVAPVEVVFTDEEGNQDSPSYTPDVTDPVYGKYMDTDPEPHPYDGPEWQAADPAEGPMQQAGDPFEPIEVEHDPRDEQHEEWRRRAGERTEVVDPVFERPEPLEIP